MQGTKFIDHYGALGIETDADLRIIERNFRNLARRFHPDNQATGDSATFDSVVQAYQVLKDPGRRTRYHEEHGHILPPLSQTVIEEASEREDRRHGESLVDGAGIERDLAVQNNILTLLYQLRRLNTREPGLGNAELERLSGCPPEHMDFHLWYLREKGWIARGDDGLLAITIDGVDRAAALFREHSKKLITGQTLA